MRDARAVWGEQIAGEIEEAVAVALVDFVGERLEFAGDVGGGDACADEEDVLVFEGAGAAVGLGVVDSCWVALLQKRKAWNVGDVRCVVVARGYYYCVKVLD